MFQLEPDGFLSNMFNNCAIGFSIILLTLVALNVYFFYLLNKNTVGKKTSSHNVIREIDLIPNIFREIQEHLNYLPSHYKHRNTKFIPIQRTLIQSFNSTNLNTKDIWENTKNWVSEESLFPYSNGIGGVILHAMRTSPISRVNIAPIGTQLKLLLTLEENHNVFFKPKQYELSKVLNGKIYGGLDRHNSEVFAYYLAMVMNFKWIVPCGIRRIHVSKDVYPVATRALKHTMIKKGETQCIYGKCKYCHINKTVCPDKNGEIEGATILFFHQNFETRVSPWRRSYTGKKMLWEMENSYCTKLMKHLTLEQILNQVDVSIFDFLIQNGDRHHYQVYKDKIILMDNGKGLGNPIVDELDILAPLYQCCKISFSTWKHLEMLSGGILTESIKLLASFQGDKLATEEHYVAVERRLLKIYATIQYCIGKHGSAKVFV